MAVGVGGGNLDWGGAGVGGERRFGGEAEGVAGAGDDAAGGDGSAAEDGGQGRATLGESLVGAFGDVSDLDGAPPYIADQLEADLASHAVGGGAGLEGSKELGRFLGVEILSSAAG